MAMHFDRWERDPFFSAAEEVQESADRMESTYRTWLHSLKNTSGAWNPEEIRRDLRTALGTAKWQLEEFERAVKSSYRNSADEAKERHRQFILAMVDKIAPVENSLQEAVASTGKKSTTWVRLDEGERDELALFLSGPTITEDKLDVTVVGVEEETINPLETDRKSASDYVHNPSHPSEKQVMDGKNIKIGHRRTASAADIGSWSIIVPDDNSSLSSVNRQPDAPPRRVPSFSSFIGTMESAKFKFPKNGYRKWKATDRQQGDDTSLLRSQELSKDLNASYERSKSCLDADDCYNKQLYGWYGALQRLLQRSQYQVRYSRSMQVTCWIALLMISIVLFVLRAI